MLSEMMTDVARSRAAFARDMLYMTESAKDAQISEAMLVMDTVGITDAYMESDIMGSEEVKEISAALDKVSKEDCEKDKETEIDCIVNSDKPLLSIDEVMGLADSVGEDNSELTSEEIDAILSEEDYEEGGCKNGKKTRCCK